MLSQTKRVVDMFKAAGLDRSQFSVKTGKNKYGEWNGTPNIIVSLSDAEKLAKASELLSAGFSMRKMIFECGVYYAISVPEYGETPSLRYTDYTKMRSLGSYKDEAEIFVPTSGEWKL